MRGEKDAGKVVAWRVGKEGLRGKRFYDMEGSRFLKINLRASRL